MKFFHLRVTKDGGVYHRAHKKKDEKTFPQLNARGGMTIGYVKVNKDDKNSPLHMVFSRCSERDVFNRKRAIQICLGRYAKDRFTVVNRPEGQDIYETLIAAAMKREKEIEQERNKLAIKTKKA